MLLYYFNIALNGVVHLDGLRVLGIVCLDQLNGACHTHISYHNKSKG